ncbi:host cell factor 2-like [Sesbania bispinosa]|nr:host cell factor 2-like [Sesbania bispinosa]
MASKQQAKLAGKLAKRNFAVLKKKENQDATEQDLQVVEKPRVKRQRMNTTPTQEIPATQAPTKEPVEGGEEKDDPKPEGAADEGQVVADKAINVEGVPTPTGNQ